MRFPIRALSAATGGVLTPRPVVDIALEGLEGSAHGVPAGLRCAAHTDGHAACRALLEGDEAPLVTSYGDLRLGGTDASVITLAERLGTTRIATLNHRHFTVVRPRHTEVFELLP
jgi:hypothetical protein